MARREWGPIIDSARNIVNSYQYLITLRQLHYRLVMSPGLGYSNSESDYKRLSELTAIGRRERSFPALQDQTRTVHRDPHWKSPGAAVQTMASWYERDRTEGQEFFICLAGEKATLLAQLDDWFNNDNETDLGIPFILTRGYGSQTYVDQVKQLVRKDKRKAVLIYAGDLDPSGEDILRDFQERTGCWDHVEHIAVKHEQIVDLDLAIAPGKYTDSRAARFIERHGELIQVEVEAIEPDDLRQLYQDALDPYWDSDKYQTVIEQEEKDKAYLKRIAANMIKEEQRSAGG
jgi:hypothetical protein